MNSRHRIQATRKPSAPGQLSSNMSGIVNISFAAIRFRASARWGKTCPAPWKLRASPTVSFLSRITWVCPEICLGLIKLFGLIQFSLMNELIRGQGRNFYETSSSSNCFIILKLDELLATHPYLNNGFIRRFGGVQLGYHQNRFICSYRQFSIAE